MELPIELRMAIENCVANNNQKSIIEHAAKISEKYRNQSGTGQSLINSENDALAYVAARMPATYGAVYSVLEQLQKTAENENIEVKSLIDVGSGTGATAWAAHAVFDTLETISCYEREPNMIKIGKQLLNASEDLSEITEWNAADITKCNMDLSADVVVASYVLSEMTDKNRADVLARLWNKTKSFLVLVEPGTPKAFNILKEERKYLIENGGCVVAPCLSSGVCPIAENDWCHFSRRIARSKLHKLAKGGDAPYEDEKYSYLIMSKRSFSQITNAVRVIRHPFITPGQIDLTVCDGAKTFKLIVRKKDGEFFKIARKCDNGDLIIKP